MLDVLTMMDSFLSLPYHSIELFANEGTTLTFWGPRDCGSFCSMIWDVPGSSFVS